MSGASGAADPSLVPSLAIAAARARWPGIAIDDAACAADLTSRVERDAALPVHAAEVALAHAALAGCPVALRAVHGEMFERVDRVLGKLGLTAADADDVRQEVRAKLAVGARKLSQYNGSGPLVHWVASVAGREGLGHLRRRRREPLDALHDDDLLEAADDPALIALRARHQVDFKRAFQEAVGELAARDRAVLRALIVDDRSVAEIAAVYGIHRVTASRWLADIRHALLRGTRRRLGSALGLDAPELESAIRMIDTNLDLSLYRLLA